MKYVLSRAFVEFGPFPAVEILDFHSRGLLRHGDFVRNESSEEGWVPCDDWVESQRSPLPAPAKKKSTPAAKKNTPAKKPSAPAKKKAAPKKP